MKYEIVLTEKMYRELFDHLLADRSQEQMAITLCGVNRSKGNLKLLGRHLILLHPDAFSFQSAGGIELRPEVQSYVLSMAAEERLSQVDWHSHPGHGPGVHFSGTDDRYEHELTEYLNRRIPGTYYASVVVNDTDIAARIWLLSGRTAAYKEIWRILYGGFKERRRKQYDRMYSHYERVALESEPYGSISVEDRYSRQVLAFGAPLQEELSKIKVGVAGLGGLGSILVEELSRLGICNWVLVDDDCIEESNLNRVTGSTMRDVRRKRSKVAIAMGNIQKVNPVARVFAMKASVLDPMVLKKLKQCDLIAVCTDNDSSRLAVNRLSAQYLIPLLHMGYAIETDDGKVVEISGEYAITTPGEWCLLCSGIADGQSAARELASPHETAILRQRGYIDDTPAPAVYHLDGVIASVAVAEVHNMVYPYRDARPYQVYDDMYGTLLPLTVERRDGCPVCSPDGLLGLGDLEPLPDYRSRKRSGMPLPTAADKQVDDEFSEAEMEGIWNLPWL